MILKIFAMQCSKQPEERFASTTEADAKEIMKVQDVRKITKENLMRKVKAFVTEEGKAIDQVS